MATLQRCAQCGTRHPPDSAAGLCPACLVRLATLSDAPGEDAPPASASGAETVPGVGSLVGDYVLEASLGAGGMGVVFRARHRRLPRVVALKMLPFGPFSPEAHRDRFRAEAASVAALRHPHIVTLYEIGEHAGQPFLAMEFVDGPDLARALETRRVPLPEALRLAAQIAAALGHAHKHGVAHRDLKPSNILLDAEGQPRVTDFGLAKNRADPAERTVPGQPFGSPNYLPPEQARGQRDADPRLSDVYGLGAILYHLLTRRPPFVGETAAAVLHQVAERDPIAPRLLDPAIPRDLETVCLRCLEKDPRRRYRSAAEVAAELGRFQRDEPILARPLGPAARAWRWCRRRPALAGMTAFATGALAAGLITALLLWRRAETHARLAGASLARAELGRAEDQFDRGEAAPALARLARLLRADPANAVAAQRIVSALTHRSFLLPASPALDHFHDGRVSALAVAPDRLATAEAGGRSLVLWRTAGAPIRGPALPLPAPARLAAFSADGARLAVALRNRAVQIWDLAASAPALVATAALPRLPVTLQFDRAGRRLLAGFAGQGCAVIEAGTGAANPLAPAAHFADLSPDGRWIATVTANVATLWDAATRQPAGVQLRHAYRIESARFSPDSRRIATASADMSARIWDAATGRPLGRRLTLPEHAVDAVFSPDGQRVLVQVLSTQAMLWDAVAGLPLSPRFPQAKQLHPALFSPDGLTLLSHHQDRVWLRDAFTGAPQAEPVLADGAVSAARFLAEGRGFVTTAFSGAARVWSVEPGDAAPLILPHQLEVLDASFHPDGRSVLTIGKDPAAKRWSAATGVPAAAPLAHERRVALGAFSASGTLLATADVGGTVRLWDAVSHEPRHAPLPHAGEPAALAFSRDDRWLVVAAGDQATVWSVATGRHHLDLPHAGGVRAIALSPDSRLAVTAGADRRLRVWRIADGAGVAEFRHRIGTHALAFSPAPGLLAATDGNQVRFWDPAAAKETGAPLAHSGTVLSLQFSADGRLLATASADHTARVWSAATRQPLTPPLAHQAEVASAAIGPDGSRVLTASHDGTARIWDLASGLPVSDAFAHANRVVRAAWSPDGRAIVTASWDGTARLWRVPPAAPPAAAGWLAGAAEACGGLRLAPHDVSQRVPREAITALAENLPAAGAPEFDAWARWLLAERAARPIGPGAAVTAAGHARNLFSDTRPDRIRGALRLAPMDPRGLARWSRQLFSQSPDRNPRRVAEAEFAAGLAARLDPSSHDAWWSLAHARLAAGDAAGARAALQRAGELPAPALPPADQRALEDLRERLARAEAGGRADR